MVVLSRAAQTALIVVAAAVAAGTATPHGHVCPSLFGPSGFDPSWSPNGRQIALTWRTGYVARVAVFNLRVRKLAIIGAGSEPSWSPDGKRLVFVNASTVQPGDRRCGPPQTDLFIISFGGSPTDATPTVTRSESEPAWSPDGSRIAFSFTDSEASGIGILDLTTGSERVLTSAPSTSGLSYASPTWSPNSRKVAFVLDNNIAVINADGSGLRKLANRGTLGVASLAWSATGRRFAFSARSGSYAGIGIAAVNGTGLKRITRGPDSEPAWSPDGRKIVFVRLEQEYPTNYAYNTLRVISSDGHGRGRRVL